ncbi:transmembrane protein 8B [Parasteatoda tepidariorum]|uniref:transmembrane protein 8B n=1 Tax=Parasteatoda tepidariorum TaxID=114398 RepID=UPI001C728C5B|nr:transmembrane protein 8B [Parasteatoda tepidariorum]
MISTRIWILIAILFTLKHINSESLQTQILEARQLYPLRSYKDIQLFQYTVPPQVTFASFQYKANGSFHCPLKTIAVYLQYGSYPVMSLQNSSYPNFFVVQRMYLHDITLLSDAKPVLINITNPLPGNWYAAAFLVENTERISQKGLFVPCQSFLSTSLKMSMADNIANLLHNSETSLQLFSAKTYRFFAPKISWFSKISITNCSLVEKCPVIIRARQLGLPSTSEDVKTVNCNESDLCMLKFVPAVSDWNYISIENLNTDSVELTFVLETEDCRNTNSDSSFWSIETFAQLSAMSAYLHRLESPVNDSFCWPEIPLMRISFSTNLAFEYNLFSEEEDIYPFILNISDSVYSLSSFQVLPTVDIGGTLSIDLAVSPFMNFSLSNVSVSGCLSYGIRPDPEGNELCDGKSMTVNTSSWEQRFSTVFIPFPEAGIWYYRLKAECYTASLSNISYVPCESSKIPIYLRIRSAPCILGNCGKYGTCYQYVSGGLIFSTCTCIAGYKGWGCTDNSTARSDAQLLTDVLLLTLSNMLFIPAVILSIYRKYYTEAFIYFATMISSAVYHACDSEVYSYCLIRITVLQFCDFYLAVLSVWVTLIAMAQLPHTVQSFVHMVGAVGVALGVEYDRTGLLVFVLPTGSGLLILFTSWVMRCYKTKECHPTRKTWLFRLVPGICLALVGLVIYLFFETKDNYAYVHSAWHATIALSVLFFLPNKLKIKKSTPEPTSSCSYIRVADVNGTETTHPVGTAYSHLLAPTP